MNESLSDVARVVLAFIRDHPGFVTWEIARRLAVDHTDVLDATTLLVKRNLVMLQFKPVHYFPTMTASGIATYYPA